MSRNAFSVQLCLIAALFVPALAGCGASSGEPPAMVYPVTGVITYKGKPIVGADVTFSNEGEKRSAFARTDEEGRYQLTTFSQNDGAVEGKSIVTVTKFVDVAPATPEADLDSDDYDPPSFGAEAPPEKSKSEFPEKYSSAKSSGLFANVLSSGENKFDFELK